MLQDLRFTFRLIAKERWFTAVAVTVLALGIGVNAIGFTVVHAVFLRGLPYANASRLHLLAWHARSGSRINVSNADLQDWRAQNRTFDSLAAFNDDSVNISDDRALPEQARGARVTANAFGIVGQSPFLGRDFTPDDERPGAEPVVIIGYGLWNRRYGADRTVLGHALRVNGQPLTIVGVMPASMKFPMNTEIWPLFSPAAAQEPRTARTLTVFGLLRRDVSVREAQAEFNGVAQRLAAAYPDTNKDLVGVRVETFTERFVGGKAKKIFPIVMAAACFVLLIACANVANLLLSRSAHRAREIAVRMALGASRARVVRQLLLESVVLGGLGGGLGVFIAIAGARIIDAGIDDPSKPFWIVFTVDATVFAYVVAICMVTAVLFGLAPALHVTKSNMNDVLKEGGRGSAGSRRTRWMSGVLVVAELALTVVLLAGGGLMMRSFAKLYALDVGFDVEPLTTMRMQLADAKYATPESRRAFYERLEPRLAAIPGVEALAVTNSVPGFGADARSVEIDGQKIEGRPPSVPTVTISPRFFEVGGRALARGRGFNENDGAPGSETVVINEQMASQFFKSEDPIGRRLRFVPAPRSGQPADPPPPWRTIVGVSPTIRHGNVQENGLSAVIYVPYRQEPPSSATLLVRSRLAPSSIMDAVRREVQAVDRDQPVFTIQTFDQLLDEVRLPYRIIGGMFAVLAAIALVLSAVGLYGVMAYSVTQRTQEIGVRMALGAGSGDVSWLILKRGLVQLGLGLTLGLAGALAVSRVLQSVLIQITPSDPVTFLIVTTLLIVVSVAACLLPARRATRVDPLVALRAD